MQRQEVTQDGVAEESQVEQSFWEPEHEDWQHMGDEGFDDAW